MNQAATTGHGGRVWRSGRTETRSSRALVGRVWGIAAVLAVLLVLAYLAASAYVTTLAARAERYPPRGTPADVGLTYEPVSFQSTTDGTQLRGWYLPSRGQRAIVEVHGINGNRWDTQHPWLTRMTMQFVEDGFDVMLFDLRGHGESGGDRVGLGWQERGDVAAAVEVVERRGVQPGRIGLFGASYGGGTALLSTAAIPSVGAVVTDSAFADQRLVLDNEVYLRTGLPGVFSPGITLFSKLLYGLDMDAITPEKAVVRIAPRPMLLIHGTADSRVPVAHAYRLKAASQNPAAELWIVPGAEHTESYLAQPDAYPARVLTFFDRHLN